MYAIYFCDGKVEFSASLLESSATRSNNSNMLI